MYFPSQTNRLHVGIRALDTLFLRQGCTQTTVVSDKTRLYPDAPVTYALVAVTSEQLLW